LIKNLHKYLDKWTKIGTQVEIWLSNNQEIFQLHKLTTNYRKMFWGTFLTHTVCRKMEECQWINTTPARGAFATFNGITKQACATVKFVKDPDMLRWCGKYCQALYSTSENRREL